MITLDIFADPVCPWCLIGKARLDRALEARPEHGIVLAWHPFQLNPTMPPEGMGRDAYLAAKFGRETLAKRQLPVLEAAAESGITLNLAAIDWMPNTVNALRLLHWAGVEGCQTRVMSALMRAFWHEGRNIGDLEVLTEIGANSGLDRALIARLLASDADRDTVLAHDAHARERGVRAMPTFILGEQHVIEGAQSPEFWLSVIDELADLARARAAEAGPDTEAADPAWQAQG
ncbi:MAG: DsbA family oxidoreductase [Paracoccaceae bacterium]|jgi:predicted DsbA family dithiol-disulfide isomerase|nr:DsbA family oxidoreductase [Paracoccaceae bacterium]